MHGAVPDRLPDPVELAAYFVVSEALTNVVKHASATRGVGAARAASADGFASPLQTTESAAPGITAGSGLAGLRDRLEALDATLAIDSPPGRGTTIRAELPCAS